MTYVSPSDRREYTFRDKTGSRFRAYVIGERVPVLYDPARPTDAQIDSWANKFQGPLISGGLGVVFTGIGSVILMRAFRRGERSEWLRRHGRERWVAVHDIDQDFSVEFNGQFPFVLRASWQDERTGRTHTASSDPLWQPPAPELVNRPVRVLFDPANPDRNLIDLNRL